MTQGEWLALCGFSLLVGFCLGLLDRPAKPKQTAVVTPIDVARDRRRDH